MCGIAAPFVGALIQGTSIQQEAALVQTRPIPNF